MAEQLIDTGSNLTPETFLELLRERRLSRREQSEAGTYVARVGKRMKDLGINREAFAIFEKLSDMETDEALVVLKAVVRYGKWAERPFATQGELFAGMAVEQPKQKAKDEYDEFQVDDEGYNAGFGGQPIDSNPYNQADADSPNFVLWRGGWHKGQEARVHKAFGGKPQEVTASPGKRGRPKRKAAEEAAAEPSEPSEPTKH